MWSPSSNTWWLCPCNVSSDQRCWDELTSLVVSIWLPSTWEMFLYCWEWKCTALKMLNVAWCSLGPPAVNLKHTERLCVCADCVQKSPATVFVCHSWMTLETNRDCSGERVTFFVFLKGFDTRRIMTQRLSSNIKTQFTLKVKKQTVPFLLVFMFFHLIMNQSLEANCTSKKKKKKACKFVLCVIVCAMVSTIWVQEAKMDTFPGFYLIVCSSSCSICDGTKWAITKTMKVIPVELKMIANLQHIEISLFRTGWYTNIIGKCLLLFLVFSSFFCDFF